MSNPEIREGLRRIQINSFNSDAGHIDFPPAKLVRNGPDLSLSFSNPFHFYRELKDAAKMDSATFSVTLSSDVVSTHLLMALKVQLVSVHFQRY